MSQSEIEVRVYDRLPEPYRTAATALARASFHRPNETDVQRAEHRDRFSGWVDAIRWIVALHADEVVGLAVAFRRTIEVAGVPCVLGGLGDVCVAPEYRRQGIALRVTLAAMREIERAECDVAYLCALLEKPGLTELYGRAGFVRIPQGHTFLGTSGARYTDFDGMVAPVRSPALFATIVAQSKPFDIGRGNW